MLGRAKCLAQPTLSRDSSGMIAPAADGRRIAGLATSDPCGRAPRFVAQVASHGGGERIGPRPIIRYRNMLCVCGAHPCSEADNVVLYQYVMKNKKCHLQMQKCCPIMGVRLIDHEGTQIRLTPVSSRAKPAGTPDKARQHVRPQSSSASLHIAAALEVGRLA